MTAVASERIVSTPDYEEVRARRGERSGLTMVVAVHRTVDGRSLGGCRMWTYAAADDAAREAERLAQSMTFKAVLAGLPLGGAKAVIALESGERPSGAPRQDILRDFAELVESFDGRYITAQDVGTSLDDMTYLSRFTRHLAGHPIAQGGSGDPSPYTAHGVEVAIRTSLRGSLAGRHVVVIGLGHVGGELARRLYAAGARLTVTDADERKRALARQLGARWVSPEQALSIEADLLAPCALGGILDRETVQVLQVPVVAGAANNQLADDSVADELRDRGIVWAPDFVINAGGLIAVADELHGFDLGRVERAIEGIADTLSQVYVHAGQTGTNTLIAAKALASQRLRPEGEFGDDDI
jgi:leucine dehydrogenase